MSKELTVREAMDFITGTLKFGSVLGLGRMKAIMEYLGHPEKKIRAIHVAGTNGKGSVCAIINEILIEKGLKVGLFTSPYIENFRERIQINSECISEEDLALYAGRVKEAVDFIIKEGYEHPTEFEIITSIMFLYFSEMDLDFAVIEVGLGGDMDSTNVLTPALSVITSISYDHMQVLGNTLGEIASSKAGIIKNAPVISYPQLPEAEEVIRRKVQETDTELTVVDPANAEFISFDEESFTQKIHYKTKNYDFTADLSLLGLHQLINSLVAVEAAGRISQDFNLEITEEDLQKALRRVQWMGRFERMNKNPLVIIDGAHNTDGITMLKKSMDFYLKGREYILILGILADKETDKMADIIARDAKEVICVTPHSERASLAKDLYEYIVSFNSHTGYFEDYSAALDYALLKVKDDDYIIASGSLYMVGDLRKIMRERFSSEDGNFPEPDFTQNQKI